MQHSITRTRRAIARRVKTLLSGRRLTERELGVAVKDIASGKADLTVESLVGIAEMLDVEVVDLFDD